MSSLKKKSKLEKQAVDLISASIGSNKPSDLDPSPGIFYPQKYEFRASRLPFCPREMVIHHRYPDEALREESYGFRFYVGIGTAVHEVIQQFLGMNNVLYGHWSCCGVIEKERLGSRSCPVCGRPQMYEEYNIEGSLGAHVDGIVPSMNAVWEFKTTGSSNLPKLTSPYKKHHVQASAYLEGINLQEGWDLDKIVFVYLSRDRPQDFKVFVVDPIPDTYTDAVESYSEARDSLYSGHIPEGICKSSSEGSWSGCTYAGICFSPSLDSMLLPVSSLRKKI
tara:strand:- start:4997 stop:5833 length:837 start_codon:yes stop_codon:yes gene_type:complete